MTSETKVFDLAAHRDEHVRQGWLQELAAVQEYSFGMMHERDLDWARLGGAAEEAAALLAIISTVPQEFAAAA